MIKGTFKHYKIENKMNRISYDIKMEDFKYVRIDFTKKNEDHIVLSFYLKQMKDMES